MDPQKYNIPTAVSFASSLFKHIIWCNLDLIQNCFKNLKRLISPPASVCLIPLQSSELPVHGIISAIVNQTSVGKAKDFRLDLTFMWMPENLWT